MEILTQANAAAVRWFAIGTIAMAFVMYPTWGLVSALVVSAAGVFIYFVGGNENAHGPIRRIVAGVGYMTLLFLGVGIGV